METGQLSVIAIVFAVLSLAIRWRIPSIPKSIATFAIIGSVAALALLHSPLNPSDYWPMVFLAATLAGMLDFLISSRRKNVQEKIPSEYAKITVGTADSVDLDRVRSSGHRALFHGGKIGSFRGKNLDLRDGK